MLDRDWTNEEIVILAFDHRGSFMKKLFGIVGRLPTEEETKTISEYKKIVYDGFRRAIESGVKKESAGILVDEQFGSEVVLDAKEKGFNFAMPVEKSGQKQFDFEYGQEYGEHIKKFDPTFSKVLVRLNPQDSEQADDVQLHRLAELSNYLKSINKPFLFELLVPATKEQLEKVGGDVKRYDLELRPALMSWSIAIIQAFGIEPDIWKIEGIDSIQDANLVVRQIRSKGRKAGVVILGRGADSTKVEHWLDVASKTNGVVGFAIGRTIFWDALVGFKERKHDRDAAVDMIAQNYSKFAKRWTERNE